MNHFGCEHESEVAAAARTGAWSEAMRLHAAECADCGAVLHLAQALNHQARQAEAHAIPPDAHWILQRSRRKARQLAMRRVAHLLGTVRILAALYVVAVALWLVRGFAEHQFHEVMSALPGSSAWLAAMGATVAAGLVIAGLWPILREPAHHPPHR